MQFGKKKIPAGFMIGALLYLAYTYFFTPNFFITIPVVLFPIVALRLFWVDRHPNVIFWAMLLQWLSASTQLLYANFLGVTLAERMKEYSFPADMMESATLLSVIGLYSFSIGLYWAIRKLKFTDIELVIDRYSPVNVFTVYIGLSIVVYMTSNLIWGFPAIVQYIYLFFYIKWGFFLLTFYIIHKRAPHLRLYFYGFIFLEAFLGLNSFFAREILLITMFAVLGAVQLQSKLNFRAYALLIIGTLFLVHYLVLWTSIKREYRKYVSNGGKVQTIRVSQEASREKFFVLINNVDSKQYQEGIEDFVNRLGYIQFFASSLDYVPRVVSHQNGKIYLSALQHYLIPRFLNPDKEVLDDSKHTAEFTGLQLLGAKEATSFSLGYIADAYIDFGRILMFPLLVLFGWLFGYCYAFLVQRSPNEVWVWILTSPFIILVNIYGADTKKAFGGLIIYFLTVAIVRRQFIRVVDRLLLAVKNS